MAQTSPGRADAFRDSSHKYLMNDIVISE
jgi:hypothetical protein